MITAGSLQMRGSSSTATNPTPIVTARPITRSISTEETATSRRVTSGAISTIFITSPPTDDGRNMLKKAPISTSRITESMGLMTPSPTRMRCQRQDAISTLIKFTATPRMSQGKRACASTSPTLRRSTWLMIQATITNVKIRRRLVISSFFTGAPQCG